MKRFIVLGLIVVSAMASALDPILYYSGNYEGDASSTAYAPIDDVNANAVSMEVWEYFNLASASTITSVFCNQVDNTTGGHAAVAATVSIRHGIPVAGGSGGVVDLGPTVLAVAGSTATTRSIAGAPEYTYTGTLAVGLNLAAGDYWMSFQLNATAATYQSNVGSTKGVGHIGLAYGANIGQNGRGLSYLTGDSGGAVGGPFNFTRTDSDAGFKVNVSQGVMGTTQVVPEPATWAVLGLGVVALARRRRK